MLTHKMVGIVLSESVMRILRPRPILNTKEYNLVGFKKIIRNNSDCSYSSYSAGISSRLQTYGFLVPLL
jgi:hypothetical protein